MKKRAEKARRRKQQPEAVSDVPYTFPFPVLSPDLAAEHAVLTSAARDRENGTRGCGVGDASTT